MLGLAERDAFIEMLSRFYRLARRHSVDVDHSLAKGWHTSRSKILHNAMIGYVMKGLK
jgi:hypothetical protein